MALAIAVSIRGGFTIGFIRPIRNVGRGRRYGWAWIYWIGGDGNHLSGGYLIAVASRCVRKIDPGREPAWGGGFWAKFIGIDDGGTRLGFGRGFV